MKFEEFLHRVGYLSVIDSKNLSAGMADAKALKVQLTRWVKSGKLIQLKRGIYLLAPLYRKIQAYEPHLASLLTYPSYISLEKALEFHGLIPERVTVFTSVTTKRPYLYESSAGNFEYQHIQQSLFWGYEAVTMREQTAFFACPEKALLDFFYLRKVPVTQNYIVEMRLQNVEDVSLRKLLEYAKRFGKPRMLHAARMIREYIISYRKGEVSL